MQLRQIPLHLPQIFPIEWRQALVADDAIPCEEQLSRRPDISDESYNENFRTNIDTKALVYAAMHAFSLAEIPKITFVGKGSFNVLFSLQFEDGFRVAARVARPRGRLPGLIETVAATMTLAKFQSGLPVPEVYAWHAGDDNAVGAPYMLMEWAEGVEAWRKWHELSSEDVTILLNELAAYHAKFAMPLPFRELGSIYFVDAPSDAQLSFDNSSAYRVGALVRGPACLYDGENSPLPRTPPTSLRELWLDLWQREMDLMLARFGSDRSTIIAEADDPFIEREEATTLGEFLDIADDMLALIQLCTLPPRSKSELYALGFAPTDYALRNIMINPDTFQITAFLDWDDIYIIPFLLCSRYPEEICESTDPPEHWSLTGCFAFLPFDEEGEFEEPVAQAELLEPSEESEYDSVGEDEPYSDSDGDDSLGEGASESDEGTTEPEQEELQANNWANAPFDYHGTEEHCRRERIKSTRFRRQYEQLLIAHDQRFGIDGFWKMREDPLKIHHLLLHGWRDWVHCTRAPWVKHRAQELRELNV